MKVVIRKGFRRSFWPRFRILCPVIIRKGFGFTIAREFKFSKSSMYDFKDADQLDINKLFGFSIGWHHDMSFRFGWRPNKSLDGMDIFVYEYISSVRQSELKISTVELDRWYRYEIKYYPTIGYIQYIIRDDVLGRVTEMHPMELPEKKNIGYRLFLYFGGNRRCPHRMVIYERN